LLAKAHASATPAMHATPAAGKSAGVAGVSMVYSHGTTDDQESKDHKVFYVLCFIFNIHIPEISNILHMLIYMEREIRLLAQTHAAASGIQA
jgi:hypothetical protein